MNKNLRNNIISSGNRGETLVEVMVAFTVLLIILALFAGAINSASAAQMSSIDARRTADNAHFELRGKIHSESITPGASAGDSSTGESRSVSLTGTDGSNIELKAYKYTGGDSVYWVFR